MSWIEIDQINTLCWWCPGWDLCWFSKLDIEVGVASAMTEFKLDREVSRGSFFTVAILSLCFRTLCRKDDLIAADANRFLITKLFRTWAKDSAEVSYPWSPWLCCRGCKANLKFITIKWVFRGIFLWKVRFWSIWLVHMILLVRSEPEWPKLARFVCSL